MMKTKIIAKNKYDLVQIIIKEIENNGNNCDLNHIGVSHITDLTQIFSYSLFNGDISKWDTSKAIYMDGLFYRSKFTGDIPMECRKSKKYGLYVL